jgi:hypothetical protein
MERSAPRADGSAPLIAGPRWYRRRIRVLGPIYGLIPMFILGAIALVALQLGDGRVSGLIGLFAGAAAAPGLLVAGAPFGDEANYPLAVLASVPLWLVLGFVAAIRATRRPVATWSDYARELIYMTIAVGIGSAGALLLATSIVGESLIV